MPTFSSIGLHPDLQHCLFSESISTTSFSPLENASLDVTEVERADDGSSHRSFFPISTPLALLNLHPKQAIFRIVRKDPRRLSIEQVQRLRYEVASALLQQSQGEHHRQLIREHNDDNPFDTRLEGYEMNADMRVSTQFMGMISAYELFGLELHRSQWKCLSTGCRALDLLFHRFRPPPTSLLFDSMQDRSCDDVGGIPFGYITQLSGPPASGKTQLMLSVLSQPDALIYHTWYLCSGANSAMVTAQRLHDICVAVHSFPATVLEHTTIATVNNEYQVLQRLQELESNLLFRHDDEQHFSFFGKPIVLVIDSCSGCLGTNDANLVQLVGTTLRRMTRQHHLATILINGTVSNHFTKHSSTSVQPLPHPKRTKPALVRSWNETVPDINLWLDPVIPFRAQNPNTIVNPKHPIVYPASIIRVTMTQHPGMNSTIVEEPVTSASFLIGAGGISDLPSSS
jgi:hypothetical protein